MIEHSAPGTTDSHAEVELHEWGLRPWVCAGILGLAGLLVYFVTDGGENVAWRMALAAGLIFGALALAFTLEAARWKAPAIFAAIASLVMAGIAWRATNAGDRYADEEFWVAAGVLAVTLSVPLFQAGFHRYRWKTDYKATHFHVWTDAITAGGAFVFLGLSWALLALLSELFAVIQITVLRDVIDEGWFIWSFSGAAFGAALGVLRNQLKIIGTLQNVVLLVLSILAVPLAVALVIFLLSVLVSGLDVLWGATENATPLLLAIAVGCFVLANSVVRDDDEQASDNRVLRMAGFVLALGILPLAVMAAISMGTRIGQHGLSPERLWALVAIAVAVAYGVAYFVSALRGRREGWRAYLRQSNLHIAVVTLSIALILALPIFNFGSISANNQLARLQSGAVSAEDFDYSALRWDFGDAGREALEQLTESGNAEVAKLAKAAQDEDERYWRGKQSPVEAKKNAIVKVQTAGVAQAVDRYIAESPWRCQSECQFVEIGEFNGKPLITLIGSGDPMFFTFDAVGQELIELIQRHGRMMEDRAVEVPEIKPGSTIELRPYSGQQLYIDGKPASAPFE